MSEIAQILPFFSGLALLAIAGIAIWRARASYRLAFAETAAARANEGQEVVLPVGIDNGGSVIAPGSYRVTVGAGAVTFIEEDPFLAGMETPQPARAR